MAASAGTALREILDRYREPNEYVYGIVDAARDPDLAEFLHMDYREGRRWLFDRETAPHMGKVAPYVVRFSMGEDDGTANSKSLDAWANRLGTSAGILLLSPKRTDTVWRFLRSIFRVQDEDRHEFYFRYYDPRVLRAYLPTCTADEAREFFGPLSKILVESEREGSLQVCTAGPAGVLTEEVALA